VSIFSPSRLKKAGQLTGLFLFNDYKRAAKQTTANLTITAITSATPGFDEIFGTVKTSAIGHGGLAGKADAGEGHKQGQNKRDSPDHQVSSIDND
jgi:hypothetical protein